jgi:transcriptional regulator with XRE-family HTH domain
MYSGRKLKLTRRRSQDEIVSQACDLLGHQIAVCDLRLQDVAMRAGITTDRIKKLLDRRQNPRMRELAAIAHAVGVKISLSLEPSDGRS